MQLRFLSLSALLVVAGCRGREEAPAEDRAATRPAAPAEPARAYVGSARCGGCHRAEYERWQGSHHDRAMDEAAGASVLGDFADARVTFGGVRSRLFREGAAFMVETDGPDGAPAVFPVRYTFGVAPLQQYLVELRPGRIQALPIAWDARPAEAGGQRWFHVYGAEPVAHDDALHWTRMRQSWESTCAECHSTGLTTRYDVARDRFETRWAEIDVACEACHGPGAAHVAWAEAPGDDATRGLAVRFDERAGVAWTLDPATGNSRRSHPRATEKEIESCAPCHARRTRIAPEVVPGDAFLDRYRPDWVAPPAYHADGTVAEEDYVWGSFLQSRMYAMGVTCSDCHEPHGLGLRAEGARVCLTCHSERTFATTEHHGHALGSPGADCVACHMPATTFMQVDVRHDHSLRIPRPALSASVGAPDPCTSCHGDRDAAWASSVLASRPPRSSGALAQREKFDWSEAFARGAAPGDAGQRALLEVIANGAAPPLVRASAASRIDLATRPEALATVAPLLDAADAVLRLGAADALGTAPPGERVPLAVRALGDPMLSVRLAALEALLPLGVAALPPGARARFDAVVVEYVAAQHLHAEHAESHLDLANVHAALGRPAEAEAELRTALRSNPDFVPAHVNLADLARARGREPEAERLLREAVARLPGEPTLQYALGLSLVRQGRAAEAIEPLRAAAASPAAEPMHVVAYALGLEANGRAREAEGALRAGLARFGDQPSIRAALDAIGSRGGDR